MRLKKRSENGGKEKDQDKVMIGVALEMPLSGVKLKSGTARILLQLVRMMPGAQRLLIMAANAPAPNPLSILTTATPVAQELSMESSAASPWKLAP